jgi:hypothetical protein
MFRELGYGVLFYLSAMAGAIVGGIFWSGAISHGPEEHILWLVQGAIGGAILGGGAWLWYMYGQFLAELAYAGLLVTFAIAGTAVVALAQPSGDAKIPPLFGVPLGIIAWLICNRLFAPLKR